MSGTISILEFIIRLGLVAGFASLAYITFRWMELASLRLDALEDNAEVLNRRLKTIENDLKRP